MLHKRVFPHNEEQKGTYLREERLTSTICRNDFLHFPLHDINEVLICSEPTDERANLVPRYRHGLLLWLLRLLPMFRRRLSVLLH